MKKFNKASKFFVLVSVILALSVMLSCVAFGVDDAGVIKNYGANSEEDFCKYRWNIETINFVNAVDDLAAADIIDSWNVSAKDGDESIKAWLKLKSDASANAMEEDPIPVPPQNVRYQLFIGSAEKIKAPADMSYFFANYQNLKEITGLENLDTSNVTNMDGMFSDCSSIEKLDLSALNTEKVTNMSNMFRGCKSLKELKLSSLETANVTHMPYMFADCRSIKELYLDSFKTQNVRDTQYMFSNCEELTTIYVGDDWLFLSVESSTMMFRNCYLLEGKIAYDAAKTDATYATTEQYTVHIDIRNGDPIKLKVMDNLIVGQKKAAPEYIGYHYFNMIESFKSSNPEVVYLNDKGEFCAAGAGRATITTKLKDGVNGEITFVFSVEAPQVEVPESTLLSDILAVFKHWFNRIIDLFTGRLKLF